MKSAFWAAALCLALAAATPVFAVDSITGTVGASPDQIVEATPTLDHVQPEPEYGTSATTVYLVRAEDFLPPNSSITYSTVNTGGIMVYQTSTSSADWWARVHVPAGSLLQAVELQACDTSATGAILFGMARMDAPGATGSNITPVGTTGTAYASGCAFFTVTPSSPVTVDNYNKSYVLFLNFSGTYSTALKFGAFRVYYKLQVSPAPATATFTDVPTTHGAFRFVEALVAAGVTGGCGGGNYCPDAPLTRGQMAIFLSTALGLHWSN